MSMRLGCWTERSEGPQVPYPDKPQVLANGSHRPAMVRSEDCRNRESLALTPGDRLIGTEAIIAVEDPTDQASQALSSKMLACNLSQYPAARKELITVACDLWESL